MKDLTMKNDATTTTKALIQIPLSRTAPKREPPFVRTKKKAKIEAKIPTEEINSGKNVLYIPNKTIPKVIAAIIEPT